MVSCMPGRVWSVLTDQKMRLNRNETFKFGLEEQEHRLVVKVFDHKTIGKDREMGQAQLDVSKKQTQGSSRIELCLLYRSPTTFEPVHQPVLLNWKMDRARSCCTSSLSAVRT